MTELEKEKHQRLLHEEMETYTDCFTANKVKFLALLDNDIAKLKSKLETAKKNQLSTVSGIEQI